MRKMDRYNRSKLSEERYNNNTMTIVDFKFFNRQNKIVDVEVVNNLLTRLDKDKDKIIYWTNQSFLDMRVGFKFFYTEKEEYHSYNRHSYKPKETEYVPELCVKLEKLSTSVDISVEDYCSCEVVINNLICLKYTPTDSQYKLLREIERQENIRFGVYNSWEDTINFLIENNMLDFRFDATDYMTLLVQDLFNVDLTKDLPKYNKISEASRLSNVTPKHIIKVVEKRINNKNYRMYLTSDLDRYSSRDSEYRINSMCEDNKYYNMIDDNRFYFILSTEENRREVFKHYFIDNNIIDTNKQDEYIVNFDVFGLLARNINSLLGASKFVITAQMYRFYNDRRGLLINTGNDTDEKEALIVAKYLEALKNGKEIKIDGLLISQTKLELIDQPFCIKFNKSFFNVIENFKMIKRVLNNEDVKYNFNHLYEELIKLSVLKIVKKSNTSIEEYKDFEGATFILNDMKIEVKKVNNRILINGMFCRIDDIFEILSRAICYMDVKDYNKYIKDVGFVGHEWKKLIGTGVSITLENPFGNVLNNAHDSTYKLGSTLLRFSFLWDEKRRTHIYLMVNGQKFLIKEKQKFKKHFNLASMHCSMRKLKEFLTDSIPTLTDETILDLVEHSVEEGKLIQRKGEELVRLTVKDINAEDTEIIVGNNNKKKGYLFLGRVSGAKYFVDKNDLSVYKYSNGSWNRRCVVNDNTKNRIFEDWLANRLINVFNEPAYIHTLHSA